MPKITVSEAEWQVARQYLESAPEGTKLPYSTILDSENLAVPRTRYANNPKPYQTQHSFIKVGGIVYAIAQGKDIDARMGDGSMSRVKYAQAQDGTSLLLKITDKNVSEAVILSDLSQSHGSAKRADKSLFYTPLTYLGNNLRRHILTNIDSISDSERLDIAIKCCWELFSLHEGLKSKTHIGYAHGDLKPDNITIDAKGNIHIIDYGLAESDPDAEGRIKTGAIFYVAYNKNANLTKRQYDHVSLRRILFMPISLYHGDEYLPWVANNIRDQSILTEDQLKQYGLDKYINTYADEGAIPNYSIDDVSAIELCAMLIVAKLQINIDYEEIRKNKDIPLAITALYFNGQSQEIINSLADKSKANLIAALNLMNRFDQLKDHENDSLLLEFVNKASTHKDVMALILLKDNGLTNQYQFIFDYPEIVDIIYTLYKHNIPSKQISSIVTDQNKIDSRVKAIRFLNQQNLHQYDDRIFYNHDLCEKIADLPSKTTESATALLMLLKKHRFTDQELIKVGNNELLAKAINILDKNGYKVIMGFDKVYHELIESPTRVQAVVAAHELQCDDATIYEIASSQTISEAVLVFTAIPNTSIDQIKIILESSTAEAVVLFNKSKRQNPQELIQLSQFLNANKNDYNISYEVNGILKSFPENTVTLDMLMDNQKRKYFYDLRYERDDVRAVATKMLELDVLEMGAREALKNLHFISIIRHLDDHQIGYDKELIQKLLKQESSFSTLHSLLIGENDPKRIMFALNNVDLLANRREDATILTIDQLSAYKAIVENVNSKESFSLDWEIVDSIKRLSKLDVADNFTIPKVLQDATFRELIRNVDDDQKLLELINIQKFNLSKEIENKTNPLLGKILAYSQNKEQALSLIHFSEAIQGLREKQGKFTDKKQIKAAQALGSVLDELDSDLEQYFSAIKKDRNDPNAYQAFKDKCEEAKRKSTKELFSHRGVLGPVDTLLSVLSTGVVFYPALKYYQYKKGIQATFFKTDTEKKLAEITDVLNKPSPKK